MAHASCNGSGSRPARIDARAIDHGHRVRRIRRRLENRTRRYPTLRVRDARRPEITVYATFLPTFRFIFIGAPYVEWLSGNQRLQAALTGVTAAVVGVIANLAVFFGLRVGLH
ncbi:MAG: hypothetical protein NVSMB2_08340 [Chloroflexota bacterium]